MKRFKDIKQDDTLWVLYQNQILELKIGKKEYFTDKAFRFIFLQPSKFCYWTIENNLLPISELSIFHGKSGGLMISTSLALLMRNIIKKRAKLSSIKFNNDELIRCNKDNLSQILTKINQLNGENL